nr:nitrite reductase [Ipomoea batatas]
MASLSVKFLAPSLQIHHANKLPNKTTSRLHATPPQTVAASPPPEIDAARLEPRVEERDGYFVLKEKFRQGINPRQNWQIRGVVLPDVPEILRGLEQVGLTSLQSGMDNVRNPVGNPVAGIDPEEIVDTRPYNDLLSQLITANSRGNPAFSNLPRKWNVCVVGSHDLYEHPHINDLAYMPAMKDGRFGFNLLVGGFFSAKRCAEAIPLDAWVPADDIFPVCKAILEAFRDLGARGNRQKARMMWLIDELVSSELKRTQTSYAACHIFLTILMLSVSHMYQMEQSGVAITYN